MLVPIPVIMDFDEYNRELLTLCDKDHDREHYKHDKTLLELWEEEKKHLLTLPEHEYDVFRYENLPVNKQGFVRVDNAKYGLSPEMNGRIIQAKIYFDRIEVYEDRTLLKTFARSYLKNDEVFDWRTYLPALTKKPGAVPHTRFFNQMPKLWQEHLRSINNRERKSALTVLMEIVKDGNDTLCDDALELAKENGRTDSDSIRQCYYLISKQEKYPKELKLSSNPTRSGYTPDLYAYDILFINRSGADRDYDYDGGKTDGGDKA